MIIGGIGIILIVVIGALLSIAAEPNPSNTTNAISTSSSVTSDENSAGTTSVSQEDNNTVSDTSNDVSATTTPSDSASSEDIDNTDSGSSSNTSDTNNVTTDDSTSSSDVANVDTSTANTDTTTSLDMSSDSIANNPTINTITGGATLKFVASDDSDNSVYNKLDIYEFGSDSTSPDGEIYLLNVDGDTKKEQMQNYIIGMAAGTDGLSGQLKKYGHPDVYYILSVDGEPAGGVYSHLVYNSDTDHYDTADVHGSSDYVSTI